MNCSGHRRHSNFQRLCSRLTALWRYINFVLLLLLLLLLLLMLIYQRINGLTARAHNKYRNIFVERFMSFYMRIVCTEMQVTRITMSVITN